MNINMYQVICFGHSGTNIINTIKNAYPDILCIELSADKAEIKNSNADKNILLSEEGLGCGLDFELGKALVKQNQLKILESIDHEKEIILMSATGGGCSSGSFLELCKIMHKQNKNFSVVFSVPFEFEGETRSQNTSKVLLSILDFISKERIFPIDNPKEINGMTLKEIFKLMDKEFVQALKEIIMH